MNMVGINNPAQLLSFTCCAQLLINLKKKSITLRLFCNKHFAIIFGGIDSHV